MSIYYSGALKRSQGIVSAIGKELKKVNLKGVKRVTITFDPFAENVKSTRWVLKELRWREDFNEYSNGGKNQ